jgi:uncharacterized membrane protein
LFHSQSVSQSVTYSSPFPPATELQALEQVQPGIAKSLMGWIETEGDHRRTMERRAQWWNGSLALLGLLGALAVVGATVWQCVRLLEQGKSVAGLSGILGTLALLVGALYIKTKRPTAE